MTAKLEAASQARKKFMLRPAFGCLHFKSEVLLEKRRYLRGDQMVDVDTVLQVL